jgi:hypothetical protein
LHFHSTTGHPGRSLITHRDDADIGDEDAGDGEEVGFENDSDGDPVDSEVYSEADEDAVDTPVATFQVAWNLWSLYCM